MKLGLNKRQAPQGQRPPESALTAPDYVRSVLQYLAIFRFVAFALGAGLVFSPADRNDDNISQVVMVVIVGLYNVVRIASPFNPREPRPLVRYAGAISDAALGLVIVLMTGGLDSGFLIYSLAPIITVSLVMEGSTAFALAVATALSVTGAYLVSGLEYGNYPWILERNYLVFALLYCSGCLLAAALPFIANLNWHRRLRADSIASERLRLRREVHDNIAQTLAFLSMKVKRAQERSLEEKMPFTAKDVSEVAGAVERAYLAVRDYLDGTETAAAETSLRQSLATAIAQWSKETGLFVEFKSSGKEVSLPSNVNRQMVQIAREALANVAKHVNPRHVGVVLDYRPQECVLRIKDDGRGFDSSRGTGHGSSIMRERAHLIGAELTLRSVPGEGTEVAIVCPTVQGEP